MTDVALLTIESIPVARYLGGVSGWAQAPDFATAEAEALRRLRAAAAAMGANAVIGWRVEIATETTVSSTSPRATEQVFVTSSNAATIYAYGTAVLARER